MSSSEKISSFLIVIGNMKVTPNIPRLDGNVQENTCSSCILRGLWYSIQLDRLQRTRRSMSSCTTNESSASRTKDGLVFERTWRDWQHMFWFKVARFLGCPVVCEMFKILPLDFLSCFDYAKTKDISVASVATCHFLINKWSNMTFGLVLFMM